MNYIGIISGSGLENVRGLEFAGTVSPKSGYGETSSPFYIYEGAGTRFYLLKRHGEEHSIPPHLINYRANIDGFKKLSVQRIVSFSAAGGINGSYKTGDMILPDNAIDFTWGRQSSFFGIGKVVHADMSYPFCPELRGALKVVAEKARVKLTDGGVYVCSNGPRLETAAEIKAYSILGGDMIGMTLFPEAALAREAEICYANVSIITNPAAGIIPQRKLTSLEVTENGGKAAGKARAIIASLVLFLPSSRGCSCKDALKDAVISAEKSENIT